jgi:hypothetical protein
MWRLKDPPAFEPGRRANTRRRGDRSALARPQVSFLILVPPSCELRTQQMPLTSGASRPQSPRSERARLLAFASGRATVCPPEWWSALRRSPARSAGPAAVPIHRRGGQFRLPAVSILGRSGHTRLGPCPAHRWPDPQPVPTHSQPGLDPPLAHIRTSARTRSLSAAGLDPYPATIRSWPDPQPASAHSPDCAKRGTARTRPGPKPARSAAATRSRPGPRQPWPEAAPIHGQLGLTAGPVRQPAKPLRAGGCLGGRVTRRRGGSFL